MQDNKYAQQIASDAALNIFRAFYKITGLAQSSDVKIETASLAKVPNKHDRNEFNSKWLPEAYANFKTEAIEILTAMQTRFPVDFNIDKIILNIVEGYADPDNTFKPIAITHRYNLACFAARTGHLELLEEMVSRFNLDLKLKSEKKSPLYFACINGHVASAEFLFERDIKLSETDVKKILLRSIACDRIEIIDWLFANGLGQQVLDECENNLIHLGLEILVRKNETTRLELQTFAKLLEYADVDQVNTVGKTPLIICIEQFNQIQAGLNKDILDLILAQMDPEKVITFEQKPKTQREIADEFLYELSSCTEMYPSTETNNLRLS